MAVSDINAFTTAIFMRKAGYFIGGAAGSAIYAAIEYAKKIENKKIVIIISDSGIRYLDTIFNPQWMKEKKLFSIDLMKYLETLLC
ncbi:hypothetical protein K7I13_07235 [Brucepastera parasyntrophica]|uniref:hypothetical protein n=1 Tax=Brucepastera parasyntrophica TaxID=2880008 RepID=UPI00210991CE|nr:hypothetical protein [Brucepastera parasyntrophica]ULQ61037.1 hypothetical protein K7I13_07235 [Brucepastera parasyntrophica]